MVGIRKPDAGDGGKEVKRIRSTNWVAVDWRALWRLRKLHQFGQA